MKRKILITGISSAIMRKLSQSSVFSDYELTGISRNPDSIRLDNIKIVKGDLLNTREIKHLFEDCNMVIHGAAVTHSRRKQNYYRVNLEATKNLVDISMEYETGRFVFISTNTAGTGSGTYGLTKLQAEEYIQQNLKNWSIFRLSEVYGGNKSEGIEKLINSVLEGSFVFCPVNVPGKFYPIDIDDAVRILSERIFSPDYLNRVSAVNGPKGYSCMELIELTRNLSQSNPRVISLGRSIMYCLKFISKILPLNFGFVPDQVDRLYSEKYIEETREPLKSIQIYIESRINSRNGKIIA